MEKRDNKALRRTSVEGTKIKRLSFLLTAQGATLPGGRRASRRAAVVDFSPHIKEIIKRMKFRLKLYMSLQKARENIEEYNEQANPGYKLAVKILRNVYRSNESAQRLLDYIRTLSFFSGFIDGLGDVQDKAMLELCKHLKYEYYPAGTYIFKEGDTSNNKYYVLLRGGISIVKKKDTKDLYTQPLVRLQAINEDMSAEDLRWEGLIAGVGVKIKELHEGEGFGEKALTEPDSLRKASILATSNCELIIIQKEQYLQITSRFDNRRQAKKAFMGKNIPFLESLNSLVVLDELYPLLQEQELPKDAIVTIENQYGRYIYFVVSGECIIEKNFVFDRRKGKPEFGQTEVKKPISNIGEGSCFGEELLLDDENQTYKYTVKVKSSSAIFYSVEKSQLLIKFPPECAKLMKEGFAIKDKIHKERIRELEKDLTEKLFGPNPQTDIKGAELFHLLNPQSRVKMAQHLYLNQRRNLKSPTQTSSTKERHSVFENSKETSIRKQLELDQLKIDTTEDDYLEPEPLTKGKFAGRILTAGANDIRDSRSLQSPTQVQIRIKTRRDATYQPLLEPATALTSPKSRIAFDPLNMTSEGYFDFRESITSPTKIVSNNAHKIDYMRSSKAPMKRDEGSVGTFEPRSMREYSSKPNLKPERFDFGPSPHESDKVLRSHKGPSQLPSPVASPQLAKGGRDSVLFRTTQTDFSGPYQAKVEFTNIVERVTGGRSPIRFDKLTDLMIKKKPKITLKKTRNKKKVNLLLIKSLESPSLPKTTRERESSNISPLSYKRYPKDGSTFRLDTVLLEDSHRQDKVESSGRSFLEISKMREEPSETKEFKPLGRESSLLLTEKSLMSLMKTKALDKLKEKEILKTKVFRFE